MCIVQGSLMHVVEVNTVRSWNYVLYCNKTAGTSWADAVRPGKFSCNIAVQNVAMVRNRTRTT